MKRLLLILILLFNICLFSQSYVPDTSFGNNGSLFNNGVYFYPIDVMLINNYYYLISQKKICKISYDGSIDTTFGSNGFVTLDGNGLEYSITGFKHTAGYFYIYGSVNDTDNNDDIFICKIDESGNFDAAFGTNNFAVINFDGRETINDFVMSADGDLFCIGSRDGYDTSGENYSSVLIYFKIHADGTLNTNFDANGYKWVLLSNTSKGRFITNYGDNFLLTGQDNQRNSGQTRNERLLISQVDLNGSPVTAFGTNGSIVTNLDEGSICTVKDVQFINNNLYVNFFHEQSGTPTGSNILKFNIGTNQAVFNNAVSYTFDMQVEANGIYITGINLCQQVTDIYCERDFNLLKKLLDGSNDTDSIPYTYSFPSIEMGYTDDQSVKVYKDDNGKVLLAGVSTLQNGGSGFSLLRLQEEELGTAGLIKNNLNAYPNPFKDIITVDIAYGIIKNIEIMDLSGRTIHIPQGTGNNLNLSCLQQKGMYVVKVITTDNTYTKKIIKQ